MKPYLVCLLPTPTEMHAQPRHRKSRFTSVQLLADICLRLN